MTIAEDAVSDDTAASQNEHRWRRLSLWSLALLVPLALAEQGYQSIKALLESKDLFARDVAWGQQADFGGSEWQLANLRAASGMSGLAENAVPVLADFTVKVGDPDLQKRWMLCRIMLVDASGRRWLPTAAVTLNLPDDVKTCNSALFSGASSGDTLKISETFLVPKDATATIRPAVGLASERPTYLHFERPAK